MAKRGPFEGSSQSSASAEAIWAIWTDPAVWQGGVIASASIDRDFALGAKITVRVKGYTPQTSTVTNIDAPRMWTGVANAPGLTLTYDHLIESTETGTVITERATMSGPLAGIAARLLGSRLAKTFTATTAHTARLAEAQV
ncbi:MAG: hypothetical protein ACJ71Z_13295 [Aeromicrobium sp.]